MFIVATLSSARYMLGQDLGTLAEKGNHRDPRGVSLSRESQWLQVGDKTVPPTLKVCFILRWSILWG